MSNNIFDFAPHELNHSAFWAWILASLSKDNHKNKQNEIGRRIASKFLKKVGIDKSAIKNISVEHQASPLTSKNSEGSTYDIKAVIEVKNGKSVFLVIETKVKAKAGSGQLEKYIGYIQRECKEKRRKGYLILLDIQGKSPLKDKEKEVLYKEANKKGVEFKIFTPADVIEIIKGNKKIDTKYDGYLVNNYIEWIEGNKDFWEYICKGIVYGISEKGNKNINVIRPKRHKGWGWKVESKKVGIGEVGLIFKENSKKVKIECWFGDDYTQIEEVFENRETIRRNLKKLEDKGWKIKPNLYFCTSINKRHYPEQIDSNNWEMYFDILYDSKDVKKIKYSADEMEKKFLELVRRGAIKNVDAEDDTKRNGTRSILKGDIKKIRKHRATLKRGIGAIYGYKTRDLLNPKELKKLNSTIANKINEALGDLPDKS
ncbi:PD-(D/E)XK nuclease family protein [Candidatus Marsarchaeota archaeon]|nr:PD-(D/E)XK nuclease family protein [Candidatus Marsarchaeota archaeon]